jgi:hypothetical protein
VRGAVVPKRRASPLDDEALIVLCEVMLAEPDTYTLTPKFSGAVFRRLRELLEQEQARRPRPAHRPREDDGRFVATLAAASVPVGTVLALDLDSFVSASDLPVFDVSDEVVVVVRRAGAVAFMEGVTW